MTKTLLPRLCTAGLLAGLLASCERIRRVSPAPLLGATGTLVELEGQSAGGGQASRPATLMLDVNTTRASGFAGCNQFGGSYALQPPSLQFSGLVNTRMACPGDGDVLERRYLAALVATRSYRLEGKVLQLLNGQRVLARFER